jgi:hypothetical protein
MPLDHIRYDLLAQDALRSVVRRVLTDAARKGLPGDHHFFISFDTRTDGVRVSSRLRDQYPDEMTIVLQHQFWDLKVGEDGFEVGLSFGGVPEKLVVPFTAIKSFLDPSVQFALQFEPVAEPPREGAAQPTPPPKPKAEKPAKPRRAAPKTASTGSVPSIPRVPAAAPAAAPAPPPPALGNPKPAAALPAAEASPNKPDKPDKPKRGAEVVRLDRFRKK